MQLQAASDTLAQLEIVPFERRRLQLVQASAEAHSWMTTQVLQVSTHGAGVWGAQGEAWVWAPAAPSQA